MPSWIGDAMALSCAVAWAIAVLFFGKLKNENPAALNLFKNVVAAGLLLLTMLAVGFPFRMDRSAEDWLGLLGSGVVGLAVADTLFLAGLRRIDASVAAVTDSAYSPAVIAFAALLLGEQLPRSVYAGGVLVALGLLVIAGRTKGPKSVDRRGVLLALSGVILTALGIVIAKPALDRSDLIEATTLRMLAGAGGLFVFEVARGRIRPVLSLFRPSDSWRYALPATFFGTYVAMILWLGGMKYGSPSRTAILNQSGAVFVIVLSWLTGEVVPARRWLGTGLALSGVVWVLVNKP